MLKLVDIKKDYSAGDTVVHALKGISLEFRKSEFVSILGQSGCGKTTMLNIIGGLDQYTSGDLIIDGVSTKHYKDRDWDNYRNHSIGFVFQSYNLIPHQTVLQNVEIALTISGVGKAERKARAIKALEEVGLGSQLKKHPSEMSGGQMQRVAIARALVNDPEIILADEPTGALDSETSVQVMDILKKVSQNRLVIMVTHNPELAEMYSTRIIRMKDGVILSDTRPIGPGDDQIALMEESVRIANLLVDPMSSAKAQKEANKEQQKLVKEKRKTRKKASMSFGTAFSLSLKNLFTKKGRTLLTTFAGSIGIIGIALIYAVSEGATNYIDQVQEDTLSSYPLTLEASSVDITTLMQTFMGTASTDEISHEMDAVYSQSVMFDMINALNNLESTENDLAAFKTYLENELAAEENNDLQEALSGIQYTYDIDLTVYTQDTDGNIILSDTTQLLLTAIYENMGLDMSTVLSMQDNAWGFDMTSMYVSELWTEMLSGIDGELINDTVKEQYEVVYGTWPTAYDEIVLVLDENNELDDMTLYALGWESYDEIQQVFTNVLNQEDIDTTQKHWSYQEICDKDYHVVLTSDCYTYDATTGTYTDLRDTDAGLKYLYDNALNLKVVGIIKPSEDAVSSMIDGSIAYTKELTEYIIRESQASEAVKAQQENPDTDIFTGLAFKDDSVTLTDKEKAAAFKEYLDELTTDEKAELYMKIMGTPTDEELQAMVDQYMAALTRADMETMLVQAMTTQMNMSEAEISGYLTMMSDEELTGYFEQMVAAQVEEQYAAQIEEQLESMTAEEKSAALIVAVKKASVEELAGYYDSYVEFSDSTYEDNLLLLGDVDLDSPSTINLYATSFENKDIIEDVIASYNASVDELQKIRYTDYVGLMMSSITTIINVITYILIAFVAISLVVSSIMIGVITLISVQERTKEIGILRAIGASKKNVSSMFNAETLIIGFTSGVFGVVITWLLCIPINAIIQHLSGITNIHAYLPPVTAAVLVVISMLLTLIAGIIPSRSAAKKDPVVALRTE